MQAMMRKICTGGSWTKSGSGVEGGRKTEEKERTHWEPSKPSGAASKRDEEEGGRSEAIWGLSTFCDIRAGWARRLIAPGGERAGRKKKQVSEMKRTSIRRFAHFWDRSFRRLPITYKVNDFGRVWGSRSKYLR